MRDDTRPALGRNVLALSAVSFLTDVSSEMIYPLLPVFLTTVLGANASFIGAIEGAAESTAALLKLASGWWSDRVRRRKPLVVAGYGIATLMRPLVAIAGSASQVLMIRVADRVGKGIRNAPRDALIAESVDPGIRGRAFGFHRAADHAGGVLGPLIAFALLSLHLAGLRTVFWLAAIPGVLSFVVLLVFVRDVPRAARAAPSTTPDLSLPLGPQFWRVLGVLFVFTLGNSTDAFLLLRATQLGVPVAMAPVLWAALHVVKSASSTPGGSLSDRVGRRPTLIAGWVLYAAVYLGFAMAGTAWQAWALFGVYGIYFGLTEGAERAFIADLVGAERRGTAFGWYNLAIGLGALPASILFGVVWDRVGAPAAFAMGATLALVAAAGLLAVRISSASTAEETASK
ncbi:MAG: major facilitator superfamily 1 [Gemmatimonadetes bacterium]|jgi:MFS family permease|nr:major facilitator superfamily 1 [Gemmatimonadota bacterium]